MRRLPWILVVLILSAIPSCGPLSGKRLLPCAVAREASGQQELPAPLLASGDAFKGENLFREHCVSCHSQEPVSFLGRVGAGPRLQCSSYVSTVGSRFLFTIIRNGGRSVGRKATMPAWKNALSEKEIVSIIRYLRHGENSNEAS